MSLVPDMSTATPAITESRAPAATPASATDVTGAAPRGGLRWRLLLGAGLGALLAMLVAVPNANAWAWDPNVHLTGRVACARPGDHPTGPVAVWQYQPMRALQPVVPGRGGRYDASAYVAAAGGTVQVLGQVTCDGRGGHYVFQRHFPVRRPWWGNTSFYDLIG
jgi:hypothetical protein